jgi:hypothetical protein
VAEEVRKSGKAKTLYIRHEDLAIWAAAERLAADPLAVIISSLLRREVALAEAVGGRLEVVSTDLTAAARQKQRDAQYVAMGVGL